MSESLIWYDVVESTMAQAQALAKDRPIPFAVAAQEQSAGRGSHGRTWQSPKGNLYLTLVLPGSLFQPNEFPLTIKAGLCLARYLDEAFGIRVTVKWPNDILFRGRKLAGILTELTSQGGSESLIFLGLGLNAGVAPDVQTSDHIATSIRDILGVVPPLESLGAQLVDALLDHGLMAKDPTDWPSLFERYGTAKESLWIDREEETVGLQKSLQKDGRLVLSGSDGKEHWLVSADHKWHYFFQGKGRHNPFLVADVGHTATKVGRFCDGRLEEKVVLGNQEEWRDGQLREWLRSSWPLFIGSVNRQGEKRLTDLCLTERRAAPLVTVGKTPGLLRPGAYPYSQLGIDRVANMEFCCQLILKHQSAYNNWLVVSLGTATTIDGVNIDRVHQGGYILPGLATSLKALTMLTTLPNVAPEFLTTKEKWPCSTQQAMAQGAFVASVGAIEHVAREFFASDPTRVAVMLSGGHGLVMRDYLKQKGYAVFYEPDSILYGLAALAGAWIDVA